MNLNIILRSTVFTAICLLASKLPSSAQVVNGSFEDTNSPYFLNGNNGYSDQYPPYNNFPTTVMFNGWESTSQQGGFTYAEISTAGYTGANGSYAVEGTGGPTALESLNPVTTIAANTTYTLTLAINDPTGAGADDFQLLATSQEANPNTYSYDPTQTPGGYVPITSPNPLITTLGVLADSATTYTGANAITAGATSATAFEDYTISFNTLNGANSSFVGHNLSILINLGTDAPVDNVRLTESPEPSTWALLFVGAAGLLFVGRRKLNA